jgi:hypothetical protein
LFRNSSVCFNCFDIGSKHQNKPKYTEFVCFGFTKQTETKPKQIFVSVRTECFVFVCPASGHQIYPCQQTPMRFMIKSLEPSAFKAFKAM